LPSLYAGISTETGGIKESFPRYTFCFLLEKRINPHKNKIRKMENIVVIKKSITMIFRPRVCIHTNNPSDNITNFSHSEMFGINTFGETFNMSAIVPIVYH